MSDDYSQNTYNSNQKKGIFTLILNQLFYKKLKNRNDLLELIRSSEQNKIINSDTRNMLKGVIDVSEQQVRNIMLPRSQIITLKKNNSLEECLDIIIKSAHSRFPVINENKDNIEGILITKDLLPYIRNQTIHFNIEKILRIANIVPESKKVNHMLKEFCSQGYHMSIVVDEFGNISGLVTIEDILELIVGKIEDEYVHEEEEQYIRQLNRYIFTVNALTSIETFNKKFNTYFSNDGIDTIGGLVMQTFGYLPVRGESVVIKGYTFKVTMADNRHIIQLHIKIPKN